MQKCPDFSQNKNGKKKNKRGTGKAKTQECPVEST